jgi:hypothetical protein
MTKRNSIGINISSHPSSLHNLIISFI